MTDGIEAVTTTALGLALDAATLRQQAIATNIANSNVVGYAPLTVDFEQQLSAARQTLNEGQTLDAWTLADVTPQIHQVANEAGSTLPPKVMLDMEVAGMAQNGVQYQALAIGLSRHFAILSMAAADGQH